MVELRVREANKCTYSECKGESIYPIF